MAIDQAGVKSGLCLSICEGRTKGLHACIPVGIFRFFLDVCKIVREDMDDHEKVVSENV